MFYIKEYYDVIEDGDVIGCDSRTSHDMDYAECYEIVIKMRRDQKEFEVIDSETGDEVTHKF
jgi:hypothetical protein